MLLERALKELEKIKIGQGAYSATYDVGNGMVMKVPLEQRYCDDEDDQKKLGKIAPLQIRKMICKDIFEATEWLRSYMPDIVTPVTLGAGGVLYQQKLKGIQYYDLSDYVHDSKDAELERKFSDLAVELRKIADNADALRCELDKVKKPKWGFIDTSLHNFMLTKDFKIVGWFDPFTPSDRAIYGEKRK